MNNLFIEANYIYPILFNILFGLNVFVTQYLFLLGYAYIAYSKNTTIVKRVQDFLIMFSKNCIDSSIVYAVLMPIAIILKCSSHTQISLAWVDIMTLFVGSLLSIFANKLNIAILTSSV